MVAGAIRVRHAAQWPSIPRRGKFLTRIPALVLVFRELA